MSSENSVRPARGKLRAALGLALLLLASFVVWFFTGRDTEPEQPPVTQACLDELKDRQTLALLAVQSMEVFGRIDPALYRTNSDSVRIELSPDAARTDSIVPPAPGTVQRGDVEKTLSTINADDRLRRLFVTSIEKAASKCGADGCPPEKYSIKVAEAAADNATRDEHLYKFTVDGRTPSTQAWQDGFLTLYASDTPPPGCPYVAPLQFADEEPPPSQQTRTTPDSEKFAPAPVVPPPAADVQTKTMSLKQKGFTSGYGAVGLSCAEVSAAACKKDCTTVTGAPGKYKQSGPDWQMCCYKVCPV